MVFVRSKNWRAWLAIMPALLGRRWHRWGCRCLSINAVNIGFGGQGGRSSRSFPVASVEAKGRAEARSTFSTLRVGVGLGAPARVVFGGAGRISNWARAMRRRVLLRAWKSRFSPGQPRERGRA